jgi:outer membrane protein assembly factor BamA
LAGCPVAPSKEGKMLTALLVVMVGAGEAPARVETPARVGMIIIIGNEVTHQGIILDNLPLYPGQVLDRASLLAAERSLRWLAFLGVGASVSVLKDGTSEYKDILVQVHETPLTYLLVGVPQLLRSRLLYGQ